MSREKKSRVAAAVKAIRDFHAVGRAVPGRREHKEEYGRGTVEAVAEQLDMNEDTVRKARQFADPETGYTRQELIELCRLIRAVQTNQADEVSVFGRTHVIRLLSVPKRDRPAVQRKAVAGGWSLAALEAHIAVRFGSRRDGGRQRAISEDPVEVLAQLEKQCESWGRWVKAASSTTEERPISAMAELPREIATLLQQTSTKVRKLHAAVAGELRRRRPGRSDRAQFRDE